MHAATSALGTVPSGSEQVAGGCTENVVAVDIRTVANRIPGSRFLRHIINSYVVTSGLSSVFLVALREPPLHWDLRLVDV